MDEKAAKPRYVIENEVMTAGKSYVSGETVNAVCIEKRAYPTQEGFLSAFANLSTSMPNKDGYKKDIKFDAQTDGSMFVYARYIKKD